MSMVLKKEVLLVQNLQLLGFPAAEAGPQHSARTAEAVAKPVLHANMFDRPNEKVLFQVLHFLLVKMNPQVEQEIRFCWPVVTPHDKTNFKKLVQSVLQDMEKSNMLPLGSSQASRLNTGYGPRTVDLIWRLSTQALKTALTRDTAGYQFVAPPSKDQAETQEAIQLLKAKIGMKTRQFQEDCLARSRIQDEWVAFATALTQKIQEVTKLLEETYEKQSKLDASVDRGFYSQAGDVQRTTKLQNISTSWETIHGSLTSRAYQSNRAVLDTTLHHHGDQPVLDAHQLRPQRSFSDRHGAVNLVDVVKNADALIQLVRRCLAQQDSTQILSDRDTSRMSAVTRESNAYIANLTTMTQHLRQLLVQIKTTNESNARDLYVEMAAESVKEQSLTHTLCPPTPADQLLQEADLVHSLKKCSMNELSSFVAQSVRGKIQPSPTPPEDTNTAPEGDRVYRRLQYDMEDDVTIEQMEL